MKRKRRHLTAEFKSRVALEALKDEKSIQQIAQDNDIAPSQVSAWKKELEERICELFERKNAASDAAKKSEIQSARLERKVGQLVIEKEFLEKSANSWGSISAKDHDRERPPQALAAQSMRAIGHQSKPPQENPNQAQRRRPEDHERPRYHLHEIALPRPA